MLSESEETAFGEALERVKQQGQQVIGYFRSHTRDGMSLAGEDAALLEKHFPDAEAVALLIKPLPARIPSAAFFVREADGSFRHDEPLVEFPFDRKAMRTETGGENRKTDALTSVTPPSALEPSRVDPPPHPTEHPVRQPTAEDSGVVTSNGTRRRFVWPSIAFACLVAGAVLGYVGARSSRSLADALAASQPYGLGLIAESAGDNLHVKWNRDTPTIQEAQRGRLYISDGTFTKAVDLDQGQLRHGSVIYRRLSGRVKFRLEVARPDRLTISETVELSLDPPK